MRTGRALLVVIASFAALALLALALPTTASAHARYKSSTPGKGEVLAASPARVEIIFTQNVQKVSGTYGIDVERDRGASITAGAAALDEADRTKMSVALNSSLTAGRYVVHWKNVSDDDGDPAEGAFSFYVQTQPTTIDLQNDQQLEQIGTEDVTPTASQTLPATAAPATAPAIGSPTRGVPTPVPTSASSGGGGSNTGLIVAIGVAAAVVLTALGGAVWYLNRRT